MQEATAVRYHCGLGLGGGLGHPRVQYAPRPSARSVVHGVVHEMAGSRSDAACRFFE